MYSESAIAVAQLTKTYALYPTPRHRLAQFFLRGHAMLFSEMKALSEASFTIPRGQSVGIIGRNGSGKSTLLQLLCGTLTPTAGQMEVNGRISALLELGSGFNPEFTGRENVFLNGAILGLTRDEIHSRFDEIAGFAGIGAFMDQPVKTYSSGMVVRLAFAVAVAVEPDILVVDEALAVGDEAFQRKCFARIAMLKERGATILFVSHSMQTVVQLCDRALLLDGGELLMDGAPKEVAAWYHRLIYAPEAEQPHIRALIQKEAPATLSLTQPVTESPESRMEYSASGAVISHPQLLDDTAKATSTLTRRGRYHFAYTVTFDQPASEVRCGMLIKTKSGVELGGTASAREGETIARVQSGQTLRVRFSFNCMLLPGTYFLNCGVSAKVDGERIFLHRIIDAVMFRVLPEENMKEAGLVDFNIEAEIEV